MSEILTDMEAAELLDCAQTTVQELARKGKLPAVQYGRSWRFPRAALVEHLNRKAMEHLEQGRFTPTAQMSGVTIELHRGARRPPPKLPAI